MNLVNVYREKSAVKVLYDLLGNRPENSRISHKDLPSYRRHAAFVRSKPYRYWFLIEIDGEFAGDLHVTRLNEIGIFLFPLWRGMGIGARALEAFRARYKPLPAVPAVRVAEWLAHVSPDNAAGAAFFRRMGFRKVQETYSTETADG